MSEDETREKWKILEEDFIFRGNIKISNTKRNNGVSVGVSFPFPRDIPNLGVEPRSPTL